MKKTAVEGTILALDYGLARIGVAVGNTLTQSAQPLVILHAVKREDRWQQLPGAALPALLHCRPPREVQ